VTIIDGTGAPPMPHSQVVLRGALIEAVLPAGTPVPHATVHDLAGATVLPGFVDAHVHLVFTGGDDPRADAVAADDATLLEIAAHNARTALAAGVTTVRDCGSRGLVTQTLRDAIESGRASGPRIQAAGPPICGPRGHLWFMGGALTAEMSAADLVRRRVAEGADLIKVMASGGHMTPGTDPRAAEVSLEDMISIVDTAHAEGVRVAAHAHSTEAIVRCVTAGVDTIEHCSWMAPDGYDYRPDVVELIVGRGIAVSPAVPVSFRRDPAELTADPAEQAYLRAVMANRLRTTRLMHELGVPIVIGTDAGCRGIGFGSIADVIPVYVNGFGLSPLQAIRAATGGSARALGIDDLVGTVAPGLRADLLVVDGDPARNTADLGRVRQVFQAGRCVARDGGLAD
jgi:imidazolonepropionase-like amidohydrolase